MFERYTQKARRVVFFARYESSQFGSPEITTEHLLLAIFREDRALLKRLVPGLTSEIVRRRVEEHSPRGKRVSTSENLPLSLPTQRTLTHAAEEFWEMRRQMRASVKMPKLDA